MASVLILYTTVEHQTAKVAQRIASVLRHAGHAVELVRADGLRELALQREYDAVIVGASVHYGRHPAALATLLCRSRVVLAAARTAFFSLSLSALHEPEAAQRYVRRFLRKSRWQPALTGIFAGALKYSRYGALKRVVMQAFSALAGGDTDASRDYEYTDWAAVEHFAGAFAAALPRA